MHEHIQTQTCKVKVKPIATIFKTVTPTQINWDIFTLHRHPKSLWTNPLGGGTLQEDWPSFMDDGADTCGPA